MLDKEKLATLCQNIISAFADETDSECIAKQKAFEINEGVPRV